MPRGPGDTRLTGPRVVRDPPFSHLLSGLHSLDYTLPPMSENTPAADRSPRPMPRAVSWAWLLALLAFPVVLWLLPADHFDEGQSMCPSVLLFDTECPGCGSTRAIQHLHHFDLAESLYFHSASPLIYAVLVGLWCLWTYRTAARLGLFGRERAVAMETQLRSSAEARAARRAAKR